MGVVLLKRKLTSFQIIILGFSGVILFGTFLLMLPFSSRSGLATPFSDALFTSTSAVCVTGLIIHDTATYWSAFGQLVILLLIQIGGMGVITVAASFAMISGRKILSSGLTFPGKILYMFSSKESFPSSISFTAASTCHFST